MIVMLVHARKGRGTVQGLEEKRAKVPWVLEEVSLYNYRCAARPVQFEMCVYCRLSGPSVELEAHRGCV